MGVKWIDVLERYIDNESFEGGVFLKNGQQLLGPIRKDESGAYVIRLHPRDKMGQVLPDAPAIDTLFDPDDVQMVQVLVRDSIIRPRFKFDLK